MIRIHGVGCSLIDYLYTNVSFSSDLFRRFQSKHAGDGGLVPGKLTFAEDFARFAEMPFETALRTVVDGAAPDAENLGGPAIVALAHAAQLTRDRDIQVRFAGVFGDDAVGERIRALAAPSGIDLENTAHVPGRSSSTIVLSDPTFADGAGERCFINDIASANRMTPDRLPDDFLNADVVLFGGTALVPPIHDNLAALARRAREAGALTVCGTVYDFRNEQRNPSAPWPLGGTEEAYPWIDLLITDREEILRLTNAEGVSEAVSQVLDRGTGAVVVTQGTEPTIAAVNPDKETAFAPPARRSYPVSRAVSRDLSTGDNSRAAVGDTTGCGDNFVGGVLTALAMQLEDGRPPLDLHHALGWGTASGGFACFYPGGLYREEGPGEKRGRIEPYLRDYLAQLAEDGVGDAVPMELRPYLGGLVQFGAGNIGRSFIGQLFARAGYPVIFVDIDEEIIGELNRRHAYPVVLRRADEPPEQLSVEGVAAVHASDEETVKAVVAAAAVVATSVGARALEAVYPLLAGGVARRFAGRAPRAPRAPRPLDIIIAENIPDGNAVFRRALEPMLPESVKIGRDIGLVETSIGKMVPLITEADRRADPLRVFAEEYNTLIVDARAFSGAMPAVPDVRAVDNIRAYVDRKLYIHNLGHAAVAYWGNRLLPSATYIAECVEVPEVHSRAAAAMHSAAAALHEQYPEDLSADELADHVVDLLARFGNHALQDTVYRVGRDLTRKLAKDERLVGALRLCISHGIPAAPIADVIVAALGFNAHDENGEPAAGVVDVRTILARDGIEGVIREVCGLDGSRREDPAAAEAIRTAYRRA